MKITVSTTIAKPIAEVWRWYAVDHVRNHPRWDPEMELELIVAGTDRTGHPDQPAQPPLRGLHRW